MQKSFNSWWAKFKLPEIGNIKTYQFEALRRIALLVYKAGQRHEREARALRSK